MKNNFLKFLLIYLFLINTSLAEQFIFKTSEIEIIDNGNLINAKKGEVTSKEGDLVINAEKFEYTKKTNTLISYNGTAYLKSENFNIEFGKLTANQEDLTITAKDDVKILDIDKNVIIETNSIFFDKDKNILKSDTNSLIKDNKNNILESSQFNYNLNNKIIKLKDVILKDYNENKFEIDFAYLNTSNDRLIGKDISINLNNKYFDKDNEPRMKGKKLTYNNGLTEITKGIFTTCKKRDKCPPWQLAAERIQHDAEKKEINYKNALLKVYDIPVMYFPKFFHPDPTVKRKSGLLIPTIKNSPNSTNYLSLPYFSVISQNKDMTFNPRFYSNNSFLLQTEYRQENKNSSHVSDFSIFNEKNNDNKTHFFYKYEKYLTSSYFDDVNLNLKVEKTSNDTYLRKNKILSPIIRSENILENNLGLNLYSENLSISSMFKVYEDLNKNNNDRYEFILPKLDIIKTFENKSKLDGNFFLKSNNFIRSYSTNILEKININNFIFNSNPKISNKGFYNNYDFILKNVNSDSDNSNNYKENENFYLSGMFQFNSSYPLIKEGKEILKIIKPRMALKVSPNYTKDLSKDDGNRLDINNIYNLDRISVAETLEGGTSLTLGNDFSIINQRRSREIFAIKLANNLRFDENEDLPRNNQLGAKNSNFFSEISYSPSSFFTTKYNTSMKNNLRDVNYENLSAEISLNNFVTTFDYLNENNTVNKNSYLTNTTTYNLNNSNSVKFSTRENKSSNLTEYYNLIYEYKNDCLAASVEYNKNYYNDRDIKPEENIFFKLTIIPFAETSSPNLKN